ncbi:signal peptide peptidase SppA [Sphingorhabdus lutea]|uniref:Signal peptide peptidase SppA n=2 Tax=Sphingorhabdus lutea TaxID=1913578 RepID=A0A1L3JF96_9SPHN|nr:signal peptide peptidase SppA [Sphingorhabdus lutea]
MVLIFMLLFFGLLYAALSAAPNPAKVKDGALTISLDGVIVEQKAQVDPFAAISGSSSDIAEIEARDVIRSLQIAAKDEQIKAVVLDMDKFFGGGKANLSDIAGEMMKTRKAGKKIYSFATAYSDDSYYLAAHSDEIWVDPLGGVMPVGPGRTRLYYKDLIDKLGVEAKIYRVGTYKSAVEPYMLNKQSEESAAATKAVLEEIWTKWKDDVAKARPQAQIASLFTTPADAIEAAKGDMGKLAINLKLVDKLGDRMSFNKYLVQKVGADDEEKLGDYNSTDAATLLAANPMAEEGEAIAVITVAGEIVDGEGGPGTAAGDTISQLIYDAIGDEDVKAIVLRVDSPGGSVTASEKIRLALMEAKAKKLPIIVSMSNLAASGGYWISTPADYIFADISTITGSIGIFGMIPDGSKALAKIGVNSDGVTTTPLSGQPDVMGGINEEFDRVAQSVIEKGYGDFLQRVATSRKMSVAQVDSIAQGRIWAGGTARQLKLVDQYGNLDNALAEAAKRAKISGDFYARYYEPPMDEFAALFAGLAGQAKAKPQMSGDLFGQVSLRQQMTYRQLAADINYIMGTSGAQIYCIECASVERPLSAAKINNLEKIDQGWLMKLAGIFG